MKILITGGAGFIGSNLSSYLLTQKHDVVIVDDFSTGKLSNIENLDVEIIESKIQDLNKEIFKEVECVIHLAAQASVPVSMEDFYTSSSNNLISSIKVFEIAKEYSVPVIYASSAAVYGNLPIGDDSSNENEILSPYALDKLTLEAYASLCSKIFSIPSIGFRFFNVYGKNQDPKNPYSGVISIFTSQSIKDEDMKIFGGEQTRDFIHVRDLCKIIEKAIITLTNSKTTNAEILNLGTGASISILSLANKIKDLVQSESVIKILSPLDGDPIRSEGNYKKLISTLEISDFKFMDLDEGLLEVISWLKEQ